MTVRVAHRHPIDPVFTGLVTTVTIVTMFPATLWKEWTMQMVSATDALIPFAGGFVARASTAVWFIETSWRLTFTVSPDGRLQVGPRSAVTPADDAFIRAHRDELLACVTYCDRQAAMPI